MFISLYSYELEVSRPAKSMFIFRKSGQPEPCWETQNIIYVLDLRRLAAMSSATLPSLQSGFSQCLYEQDE